MPKKKQHHVDSKNEKEQTEKEQSDNIEDLTMKEHTQRTIAHMEMLSKTAAVGASEGMKLALNVLGMLIAFVGLIALIRWGLSLIPSGNDPLT